MKINKSISILAILLFASMLFNAFQWRQNYWLGRLPSLKDKWIVFRDIEVIYPVNGLANTDISNIISAFEATGLHTADSPGGILSLEVLHDDYVIVETGFAKHPLHGGGKTLGFIRTPNGWIFDEKTRSLGWVS